MQDKALVVLVGDSIRMGYQASVTAALADVADVWASEANGGDSRHVLTHLDEWVLARKAQIVHVNCGLHDLKKDFAAGEAQVPLAEYAQNVRAILRRLQREMDAVIIWAATTPVDEKRHHQNKGFDRFEADVDAYNAAAIEVAGELDVEVDDLFAVIENAGKGDLLTADGVHFTQEGSTLLGNAVAACLRAVL